MTYRFAKASATLLLVATLAGCATAPGNAPGISDVNYEGLATVRSRTFDVAQIRPDTDFGQYTQLLLGAPEVAYRMPDREEREFPLTVEQQERFLEGLVAAIDKEFEQFDALEIVRQPGADALVLDIRVEDIVVTVSPSAVGRAGRAAALLEASGAAVVIVEVRDSQSNEILARGVLAETTSGGALRSGENMTTRFQAAEKAVAGWASNARRGLENLLNERR